MIPRQLARAFTLLEILVVLGVVAILVAILLPAIQKAREAARRVQCGSNLRQLGLAIQQYHETHQSFPPGQASAALGLHVALLPYLEQYSIVDAINVNSVQPLHANLTAITLRPGVFVCPSDPAAVSGVADKATNYAGNYGTGFQRYGYNGVFSPITEWSYSHGGGVLSAAAVVDGLSRTAALSEILVGDGSRSRLRVNWYTSEELTAPAELDAFARYCAESVHDDGNLWHRGSPWIEGHEGSTRYNHVLAPNSNSCHNGGTPYLGAHTAASLHPNIVHILFLDGHLESASDSVDLSIWRAYGTRAGGD